MRDVTITSVARWVCASELKHEVLLLNKVDSMDTQAALAHTVLWLDLLACPLWRDALKGWEVQLYLGQINKQKAAFLPKWDKPDTRGQINIKAIHTTANRSFHCRALTPWWGMQSGKTIYYLCLWSTSSSQLDPWSSGMNCFWQKSGRGDFEN